MIAQPDLLIKPGQSNQSKIMTKENYLEKKTNRKNNFEGALHLYSSFPAALTPGDLYLLKDIPAFQKIAEMCNIYLIARRKRIYIDTTNFEWNGTKFRGFFHVRRDLSFIQIPFIFDLSKTSNSVNTIKNIGVNISGLELIVAEGEGIRRIAAHIVVAEAISDLQKEDTDLEVLYVGQGIGRSANRTAIDRLLSHSTLQRILAETNSFAPEYEILLLLYRFEHSRMILSNGGDFNLTPTASAQEDSEHIERLQSATFSRKTKISLAEAALINYFKPDYNKLLKANSFSAKNKLKILQAALNAGPTGLIVEICSASIGSRLTTEVAAASKSKNSLENLSAENGLNTDVEKREWLEQVKMMEYSHFITFPLTNPEERNTFLHGNIWLGDEDRSSNWSTAIMR